MNGWLLSICAAGVLLLAGSLQAQVAHFEGAGRLAAIDMGGELVPIGADVRVGVQGSAKKGDLGPWFNEDVKFAELPGRRTWTGYLIVDKAKAYAYEQTVTEEGTDVKLQVELTGQTDANMEPVQFVLVLPAERFGGGTCSLSGSGGAQAEPITLPNESIAPKEPKESNQPRRLAGVQGGTRAVAADAAGKVRLEVSVEGPGGGAASLQDCRPAKRDRYEVLFTFPPPAKGQSLKFAARLKVTGEPDRKPATLRLDANRPRYRLDGVGGNYCFGDDGPAATYTLTNLNVGWARVEFSADLWYPEANTLRPSDNDKPGRKTHSDLELARRLSASGIPYVLSIWRLPQWMYVGPDHPPDWSGRIVPRERWDKVAEMVGSYLLYAKEKYAAEPELFCFNEADLGV
jgi:hypothetical protein